MASAADIITYAGIPLAVIGALPIIYTSGNGIITLRNVRQTLRNNGLQGATRGSMLAGIAEVELPRWSITPPDREDPEYWSLNPNPSTLKGGSWRLLYWRKIITGKKTYRLEFSDDLQEPQAEVDFEELIGFLLDRGAVPDAKGIHMLRIAGLWSPIGTSILLSPDRKESVLRITTPEDSDGVLSLALYWRSKFDDKDGESLPPSWVRVHNYASKADVEVLDPEELPSKKAESSESEQKVSDPGELPSKKPESTESQEIVSVPEAKSVRFRLAVRNGSLRIDTALLEDEKNQPITKEHVPVEHLQEISATRWLPSISVALGRMLGLALYSCHVSDEVIQIAQKDVLPCGVLVLCGIMNEDDAPVWATPIDTTEDGRAHHQRFMDSQRRAAAERTLPPAQAQAARALREAEEREAFFKQSSERLRRDKERRERRNLEALKSPRLDSVVASQSAVKYLGDSDVQHLVSKLMFEAITDADVAVGICSMLELWKQWTERGGMKQEDLEACQRQPKVLATAICLIACVKMSVSQDESSLALDLQECMRTWQKVRLG